MFSSITRLLLGSCFVLAALSLFPTFTREAAAQGRSRTMPMMPMMNPSMMQPQMQMGRMPGNFQGMMPMGFQGMMSMGFQGMSMGLQGMSMGFQGMPMMGSQTMPMMGSQTMPMMGSQTMPMMGSQTMPMGFQTGFLNNHFQTMPMNSQSSFLNSSQGMSTNLQSGMGMGNLGMGRGVTQFPQVGGNRSLGGTNFNSFSNAFATGIASGVNNMRTASNNFNRSNNFNMNSFIGGSSGFNSLNNFNTGFNGFDSFR